MPEPGFASSDVDLAEFPEYPDGGACGALFRQIDWSRHALGPVSQWPSILRNTLGIMLGSRQAMFLCWGPENHTLYNDAYAAICGRRHPASFGAPLSSIWPTIAPMIATVKSGESIHMDDIAFVMHRNGYPEETHFAFSYSPLRSELRRIEGVFCACVETTEQVMLRRQLDHERAQLGQIFEHAGSFIVKHTGPDHLIEMANPASFRLIGARDIVGKTPAEALPEIVDQGFIAILDKAFTTGHPQIVDGQKVLLRHGTSEELQDHYADFVCQPIRNADGTIAGVVSVGSDVTDRVLAHRSQAASERFLRSILDASPDCIKVLTVGGHVEFFNDSGRAIMEVPEDHRLEDLFWPDFWQEPDRTAAEAALAQAARGTAAQFQGHAATMAGNLRYWDVRLTPMRKTDGQPERILVVSRDMTYLRQIEDERQMLMRELSHRLKNAFGMVQSVINQTLRRATSLPEGREVLAGRVGALAAAQDILTQSMISETRVHQVIEAALLPHRTGEGRFLIDGPDISINGRQSLGLSLALHELATNATKYGALSGASGVVRIGWDVARDGTFSFRWEETGGPTVVPPAHNGFGSTLIEKIVATYFHGSGTLEFPATGVVFRLMGTIAAPVGGDLVNPY